MGQGGTQFFMQIEAGQRFKGTVTGIKPFGAFVALENKQSGLVHISELSDKFVENVEDVVSIGQEVEVRVKAIAENGRLNLSMKSDAPPRRPARSMDLDKAITTFLKDSDEKHTILKKTNRGGSKRRG